jgi:NAD(P)-dependent dehydrogenase (short-subunit alcohol dehydrogenase family)
MINNAGILGPNGPITEISYQEYRELLDINLDGVFLGAKVAAERLIEQGDGGAIVNISSLAGLQGHANIIPYTTAKAGVRNMTYALAAELGTHGIRVNAIHPGEVETALTTEDMPIIGTEDGEAAKQNIPLGKYAQPEDVANAATFLASEMASHITAESLVVDGGVFNTA